MCCAYEPLRVTRGKAESSLSVSGPARYTRRPAPLNGVYALLNSGARDRRTAGEHAITRRKRTREGSFRLVPPLRRHTTANRPSFSMTFSRPNNTRGIIMIIIIIIHRPNRVIVTGVQTGCLS